MRTRVAVAVSIVAVWAGVGVVLYQARRDAVSSAEAIGRHAAAVVAEYEGSSLRTIDLTLRQLRAVWLRDPASLDAAVSEHAAFLEREGLIQVAIVDADGWSRYSRLPLEKPLNFTDRDYFQFHKAASGDEMHISEPVLGRITKRWAIQFTRPIRDASGAFAGLIVAALPPPALETVYREMQLGRDDVITLARWDGGILARTRDFDRAAGASLAGYPGVRPGDPPQGVFVGAGKLDGIQRVVAYRQVPGYALTVYVGQSMAAVLAQYEQLRALLIGAAALATVLLLLLGRVLASRRMLRAALREREQRLAEERERLMLELHDGAIQSIYAVGMTLETARRQIAADPPSASNALAGAIAHLNLVIQDLRSFIAGRSDSEYSDSRFMAELQSIVSAAPAPVEVDVDRSVLGDLTPDQAMHVLRIAREGMSNVARHASASRAHLSLKRTAAAAARLEIADDGVGMREGGERSSGLGLHHIAARGRKLGGDARVESSPGRGTRIVVEFPVHA